jgi:hypothetical protein
VYVRKGSNTGPRIDQQTGTAELESNPEQKSGRGPDHSITVWSNDADMIKHGAGNGGKEALDGSNICGGYIIDSGADAMEVIAL